MPSKHAKKLACEIVADQFGGQVLYVTLVSRILQRLRFPRMLLHVKEEFGPDAEAVLEGLIEHGRLTVGRLVEREAARTKTEARGLLLGDGVKEAF